MSSVEFIVKTNILFEHFNENLLGYKLKTNKKLRLLGIFALGFMFFGFLSLILSLYFPNIFLWLAIIFMIIGIVIGKKTIDGSKEFTSKSFPEYDSLRDIDDFVKAYRCDSMINKFQELQIPSSNHFIDEIISMYERKAEAIKADKWWPITIAAAIIFPLWTEFISKIFDFSIGGIVFMFLAAGALIFLSVMINDVLKTIYLSKANTFLDFANTMRMVKVLMLDE